MPLNAARWNALNGWDSKVPKGPRIKEGQLQQAVNRAMAPKANPAVKPSTSLAGLGLVAGAAVAGASAIIKASREHSRQVDENNRSMGSPEKLGSSLRAMDKAKRVTTADRIRKALTTKR
jgi:hypothetical protein